MKYIFISNGLRKKAILVLLLTKKDVYEDIKPLVKTVICQLHPTKEWFFITAVIYNSNTITSCPLKVVVHSLTALDYRIDMFQI